jgi:hypothetical protein
VISNLRHSIEASLYICLSANKNPIPDLEGFQMLKAGPTAYPDTIPELSCESSPDRSAHQAFQLTIGIRKPGILV